MKATFKNIGADTFSLNGIENFKIFIPQKISETQLKIVNVYDSRILLLDSTRFDDINIDGSTFTNIDNAINSLKNVIYSKLKINTKYEEEFQDLKNTVQSIGAGEGGKLYDSLADAQAVNPKPQNGTVFTVSKKTDPDNAGYYTFQSTEPVGTRFERTFVNIDLSKIENIFDENSDSILIDKYADKNTGEVKSLATVSCVEVPVVGNSFYFFRPLATPYTNVSHPGAFYDAAGNFLSGIVFLYPVDTGFTNLIKAPANAAKALFNYESGKFNDIILTSDAESFPEVGNISESQIPFSKIETQKELYLNQPFSKWKGYIDAAGLPKINSSFYTTTPLKVNEGDKFMIENWVGSGFTPSSVGRTVSFFDSNMIFISDFNGGDYTYQVTIPAGVSYMMVILFTDREADLSIKKTYSASPINKIFRNSIYPPIEEGTGWSGKKWTSLGDSITFRNEWQPFVLQNINLIHTNCGIGSTRLAGTDSNAFWQDVRLNAVKNSDPDFLTILGGANDITQDIPIGTNAEFEKDLATKDKNTFKGAYSYIIENLLTWKPALRIFILTTTWAHEDGATLNPPSGIRYTDYANACKDVALHYGIPFVDLHGEAGFNSMTNNIYLPDNIHPNDAGGKRMAELVIGKFKSINPL